MERGKQPSQKVLQRRQFLMVLPLLVLPFLTMAFWALGGGNGKVNEGPALARTEGFNMDLPSANVDSDRSWNKMRFYEEADKAAARRETQIRNDPYYNLPLTATERADTFGVLTPVNTRGKRLFNASSAPKSPYASTEYKDPNEAKVYRKLAELDQELSTKTALPIRHRTDGLNGAMRSGSFREAPPRESPEMRQLRSLMETMAQSEPEPDPEMQEINKVLDKLMDVQHPERLNEKWKEQSAKNKGHVFPVVASGNELPISVLENTFHPMYQKDSVHPALAVSNGFYSLDDGVTAPTGGKAITAVIHEDQTLVAGATVKLRLTGAIFIEGAFIPKGQFMYGTAILNRGRLTISISGIQYQNRLYPVDLSVYDLDGMLGINIPGAITRDVVKQSADQSLQGLGLTSLDPSVGMQAATAGIDLTKNLVSKRVKLVKVMLKAGYQVLLKDNKNK